MIEIAKVVVFERSTGRIVSVGSTCAPELLESETQGVLVDVVADIDKDYVLGDQILPKGERPSSHHVFDYTHKKWADPRSIEEIRSLAIKRIESWRLEQEQQDFEFNHAGRQWDAGLSTRQRLQPVLSLSQLPEGFFWTDADNNNVPITLPELLALSAAHEQALVLKGFEIHAQQRAMKNAVEAATSKEAVESIVIGL